MTPEELEIIESKEKQRRENYRAIKDSPAIADFIQYLDAQYTGAFTQAAGETANVAQRSNYLQSALAYDIVKTYLLRQFEDTAI